MDAKENQAGLTILEKIVLLALDDKGWFGNSEHKIKFGIAGAVLYELYRLHRIDVRENVVVVINPEPTGDTVPDRVLEFLQSVKKQRSVRNWIQRIVYKKLMIRKTIIRSLMAKDIVRREEYDLLWVMYQYKYPIVNLDLKHQAQEEIYTKLLHDGLLTGYDRMLIIVMDSCKLVRKNFRHFEHYPKVRKKIREVVRFEDPAPEDARILSMIHSSIRRAIAASNVSVHA